MAEENTERRQRSLTEADVKAIVDELEDRFANRLYMNAGKGLWALAKRALFIILLVLAFEGLTGWHMPSISSLMSKASQS